LISIALLSLIAIQLIWLIDLFKEKKLELREKTRVAINNALARMEKAEDSKLIISNIDSLLSCENELTNSAKQNVKLIINRIKDDSINKQFVDSHFYRTINLKGNSSVSTTVIKMKDVNTKQVIIKSSSITSSNIEKKGADLQNLFIKMALQSSTNETPISKRFNSLMFDKFLKEELQNQGISPQPCFYISESQSSNSKKIFFKNSSVDSILVHEILLSMPLFGSYFFNGNLFIDIGYKTSSSYLMKQMAGLLTLSVLITLLVSFVMIYIFKRMTSQEKLNQLKSDFINNMSHELKTPIATISLAIDAINNPKVISNKDKVTNYTSIIKEENTKLNQHVEHILQMALLEKGKVSLNKKRCSLNEIINEAIKSNHLKLEALGATLNFTVNIENAMIIADDLALTNVVSNLIDNSLKYSKDNCIINIDLKRVEDDFVLTLSDNGIGIGKADLPFIFDKFYRVQSGNQHDVKGTGLGLSYVKSIIDLHGGSIEVISEIGKGSKFIIKLRANAA